MYEDSNTFIVKYVNKKFDINIEIDPNEKKVNF